MFGLDFLFASALFALPIAGAPLLLHLLFRRKSPTVPFSTLRFIRASVQQTAARRKLQRWLLLACRILLLALLIWAIAQPVRRLQANWTGGAKSSVAAIVIDTSYSMQLRNGDVALRSQADRTVQDLLRNELADARVAIFTTGDRTGAPNQLSNASELLAQWSPPRPNASAHPLSDRIAAARALLARNQADQKWLIVLSDLQSREFPRPIENSPDERTILVDLHPQTVRNAGIVTVAVNPSEPIPGVQSEAVLEVAGRSGDARTIAIQVSKPDGTVLLQPPPVTVVFNANGRAEARVPVKLPAEPWLVINARLTESDAMSWDDARTALVHLPPKQTVRLLNAADAPQAARFVRLALDPNEGKVDAWPLVVREGQALTSDDGAAVLLLTHWPEQALSGKLLEFVKSGGTAIIFVQPGLEASWRSLTEAQRSTWQSLLPSAPAEATLSSPAHLLPGSSSSNALIAETDLTSTIVQRMVRFNADSKDVTTPISVDAGESGKLGLLFRRPVGAGQVFTFATMPEMRYTNLPTHPLFLPLLVKLAMQTPAQETPLNVTIGQPISVWRDKPGGATVTVESPSHQVVQTKSSGYTDTSEPGLYTWRAGNEIIGYSNVHPPAVESDLVYRAPDTVVPRADNVIVAKSLDELRQKMQTLAKPQPRWSGAMAMVLILLCFEALLGNRSPRR